ncbi:hypothetical protein M5K25_013167 [Dendrobium thyrsiflorum]|uniref:Uncharacterized protein n=1 Tax=Dendrobium thyrsiflorum TaxID=117978 RepID=A0ABD0USY8_DENTH
MDPCRFVRVLVGNLALKLPVASRPAGSGVHPSSTPCFCKITLRNLSDQIVPLPLQDSATDSGLAAAFHLSPAEIERQGFKSKLKLAIYTGRRGSTCGVSSGRLLGKVKIPIDLRVDDRAVVFYSGWVGVGKSSKGALAQLHLVVKSEPDPRFVFEFGGEPECSPQVFQIQGSLRQPVFTCRFSCRNTSSDRSLRSRSVSTEIGNRKSWLKRFRSESEKPGKERKGWSVTVHDLSGSPVAMASMVTPFVASPNSDRVSRSNPGAWLILCPEDLTWKPWGRLEAWRERGSDALGYRFELLPDGVVLTESSINTCKGGRFSIDLTGGGAGSPRGSGEFGYRGFVMSSTVGGEGRPESRPVVEVGVQHVGCTEDAAAFVALAAAIDLSVDACRLFSQMLRKELQLQVAGGEVDGGFL